MNIFKRRKKSEPQVTSASIGNSVEDVVVANKAAEAALEQSTKQSLFSKLKSGLQRTRNSLGEGLSTLILGRKVINDELLEEIETILLTADVGIQVTRKITKELAAKVARKQLNDPASLFTNLQSLLTDILLPCEVSLQIPQQTKPFIILMTGINGAGKTTTIGKLAKQFQAQGKKVMLAAGDTFRAAAIEQLQVWGERNNIPVIAQHSGADSAAVIFDAYHSACAKNIDILIADTAGRLHTQDHLMQELNKVKRVLQKIDPALPHETMLVLDASIGQNALQQAKQFNQIIKITGITVTKLDGTAKGGILFAIAQDLQLPLRFIGVGESIDDLRPFIAADFVQALFAEVENY